MSFLDLIQDQLDAQDDADLWDLAVPILLREAAWELEQARWKSDAYAQVGACSHWLRPHQTRWTVAGGFAWPVGYSSGQRHSRLSLPAFDWFVLARWDAHGQQWRAADRIRGKRRLLFRAALPTRTSRHAQAAAHTAWLPSNPAHTRQKPMHPHGFRKIEGVWRDATAPDSFLMGATPPHTASARITEPDAR